MATLPRDGEPLQAAIENPVRRTAPPPVSAGDRPDARPRRPPAPSEPKHPAPARAEAEPVPGTAHGQEHRLTNLPHRRAVEAYTRRVLPWLLRLQGYS